ncbi:MAG: glucose dehydrogenase [Glaciihabitans sp.]|jgi:glucose/arabinose dehydrogenase|nr:glucose dehydrogenase [Glaciihabitans sp.]MDQ1571895.1 hypothetical protein [Actinomycetota bacterium]
MNRRLVGVIALAVALGAVGCTAETPTQPRSADPIIPGTPSPTLNFGAAGVQPVGAGTVVASGLDLPWSMVRLKSGSTLISERDTALVKELEQDGSLRTVGKVPNVHPAGEGGLLGLAVQPSDESWLYAYTSTASDNRVVRMKIDGAAGSYSLGELQVIFSGIKRGEIHNGGRIKFGPDGMLYVTAGETGDHPLAQSLGTKAGKIFRLQPDGSVPSDNPFAGSPVFSWGHRNPQGIAWDASGMMWASEFGQDTWDELNIIRAGKNYGWPDVEGIAHKPGFVDPVHQWTTAEASPSGLLWLDNTLFMAALRGERLWVIHPDGEKVTVKDFYVGTYGRMRDVIPGPNNTIWVATSNTGRAPRPGDDKILQFSLAPVA